MRLNKLGIAAKNRDKAVGHLIWKKKPSLAGPVFSADVAWWQRYSLFVVVGNVCWSEVKIGLFFFDTRDHKKDDGPWLGLGSINTLSILPRPPRSDNSWRHADILTIPTCPSLWNQGHRSCWATSTESPFAGPSSPKKGRKCCASSAFETARTMSCLVCQVGLGDFFFQHDESEFPKIPLLVWWRSFQRGHVFQETNYPHNKTSVHFNTKQFSLVISFGNNNMAC